VLNSFIYVFVGSTGVCKVADGINLPTNIVEDVPSL